MRFIVKNMSHYLLGILAALASVFFWSFGDFFIQRTVRKVGVMESLFYIGCIGFIILFPFVKDEIWAVFGSPMKLLLLVGTGVASFTASLFDLKALKNGKISVIEPVLALELPFIIFLSVVLKGERLSLAEWFLVSLTFCGIFFAVLIPQKNKLKSIILEKGVVLAAIGAGLSGFMAFLTGLSSQETSPLLTIWFTDLILAIFCFGYLFYEGEASQLHRDLKKKNLPSILAEGLFDNAAWVVYGFATVYLSISIATTIAESYIVFTVLLGVLVNKEVVRHRQVVGIVLTIFGLVSLSAMTAVG